MTAKIKLNSASGGGSFSLQAPSSSSNDRVITLPDIADGTLLTSQSTGLGKVLNYAQTLKKDTASASVAQGAISGALISLDYTAASTSNKLLLSYTCNIGINTSVNCYAYLYIGGSVSTIIGDTGGNNQKRATATSQGVASHKAMVHSFQTLIDTPATSSTTYDVRFGHGNNGTQNIYINRDADDGNYEYYARFASSLTIMELSA
jgi:hypothetical protein